AAGHRVQPRPARGGVLVAAGLDREVRAHLARGGRAVILTDDERALPADASLRLTAREGDLRGHWINNWNWIRPGSPPFDRLALAPLLGFEAEAVAPRFIIEGVPPEAFDDVACGITYGWLRETAALAVSVRVGAGSAFVTTLRFDGYGEDAYATRLLDAVLAHAATAAPVAELALGAAGKARRPPDRHGR
ncbi:MAG TPA: hypothetical protein VMZ28_30590, partial [Kofleriaceae bacterium]|nr:hypothetical protein [Kofleriaceae bacterium]